MSGQNENIKTVNVWVHMLPTRIQETPSAVERCSHDTEQWYAVVVSSADVCHIYVVTSYEI